GAFLFDNLLPGSYRLTFPTPSGLDSATYPNEGTDDTRDSDADPASGNTTVFEVLTSGEHNKTYDAAFFSFASIGDRVWEDYSANGVQDAGEPGLAGVSVALSGTTGNGTSVSRTAVTAADGSYLFNNLIPGTYKLTFTNPTGYLTTQAASPVGNSDTNSDANPVTGMTPSTVLVTGERDFTWDAGYYSTDYGDLPSSYGTTNGASNGPSHILNPNLLLGLCADAELNGGNDTPPGTPVYGNCPAGSDDENGIVFVTPPVQGADACIRVTAVNTTGSTAVLQGWMDFNGDGDVLDAGEELQLTNNGIIPAGGVADALYCFPVPAQVAFLNGSANVRFRLSPAGGLGPLGPAIGGEVEDYRVDVGRVGNLVWNDANFNGVQDAGEKGIADVPVELVWAGPDGDLNTNADNRIYNTVTNLSGQYYFSGIVKGTYRLRVLTPAMMSPARTDRGTDDVRDSDGVLAGSDQSQVTQVFTISDPLNMPLGENSIGDQGVVAGYADAQTDETHDFGFAWLDYGDLPQENTSGQSYNTTQSETGAIHATTPQLVLGTCTDAERDGQPDDDAGVYDELTTDSGDGDDGINNKGIDAQDCAGTPYAVVSASSYLCENRLIVRQINDRGSYVYYVVDGDFSPQINAAGGIAQVIGSTVIISGNATTGVYSGNQTALISCISQNDGIAESLVIIGGTVTFNLSCFDKDIVCNDDENGIRFETPLIPDNDACIRVTARNTTPGSAVLQGWIDWNGNKQLEASEALVLSGNGTIPSGGITNELFCFPVPASAVFNEGRVYARFRLSPAGNLSPDGPGIYSGDAMPAGEVEDYIVEVGLVGNLVWEDRNFDGLQGNPAIEPGMNGVDIQLTWAGLDNDLSTAADNRTYLQKTATVNGKAGMYYFRGLTNGTYRLTSTTPTDFTPTRLNQGANDQLDADDFVTGDVFTWPDVSNLVLNESGVSDMPGQMAIFPDRHDDQTHDMGYVALDLGDNPDSYSTLLPNGAHATVVPGLYLGSGVDSERDGAPDTESGVVAPGGDDNTTSAYTVGTAAGGDDENALRFLTPLVPGYEACVEISATATVPYTPAYLSAWMDYNGNDAFDTDEKITFTTINGVAANTAAPVVPTGTATRRYCFNVLSTATFTGGEAYVRLRLNTTPDIAPTGLVIYG
ncbi:MAG: SdrD B-like domain-containing protein, partial [Bacteroidota bacterium]